MNVKIVCMALNCHLINCVHFDTIFENKTNFTVQNTSIKHIDDMMMSPRLIIDKRSSMINVTTMKDVPWDNGVTAAALSNSWVLRIIPMGCQKTKTEF